MKDRPLPMRVFRVLVVMMCLLAVAGAQEGHPLTGTWSGDWGPQGGARTHLTVVLEWDGKTVSGTINPGPDAVPLSSVVLDLTDWTVRLEAEGKGTASGPSRISAEGRIEDLGSWNRTISGTWTQGGVTGDFRLTRN